MTQIERVLLVVVAGWRGALLENECLRCRQLPPGTSPHGITGPEANLSRFGTER